MPGMTAAMETLFTADYAWLWAIVLATALFFPARRLIWMMSVNRQARKTGADVDDAERQRLRRRAGVTAALVCYLFAFLYAYTLFDGR